MTISNGRLLLKSLPALHYCQGWAPASASAMKIMLQAQLSCVAPRKLREQQTGVYACLPNCCTGSFRQPKPLHGFKRARQHRHHFGPTLLVSAAVNMRVMVKLSVAKSSGKLDLSDCGLTEVPAEVCNMHDLEAGTCLLQVLWNPPVLRELIQHQAKPDLHSTWQ